MAISTTTMQKQINRTLHRATAIPIIGMNCSQSKLPAAGCTVVVSSGSDGECVRERDVNVLVVWVLLASVDDWLADNPVVGVVVGGGSVPRFRGKPLKLLDNRNKI